MTTSKGKFTLSNINEFTDWLNSTIVSRQIKLIQNHHTLVPSYNDFNNNHFSLLEGMETYHLSRGFAEIAQNITTFPDGAVAICRNIDKLPAGIKGANTYGICIENVGNFDQNKDIISNDQKAAILKINAFLCKKFNLTPNHDTIVYHHWFDLDTGARTNGTGNTKSCPGTNFFEGNNVSDADTNFIPLITNEFNNATNIIAIILKPIIFNGIINVDSLNVRESPNASGKKIKVLNKGVPVCAYEMNGSWCKIDPDESYWVNSNYLIR
jgi:hypothetical protein